ncbi:VWA domain-containing protein [Glaciecola sp. MH2013]|uniref:VIT domain-containing protein n=1 Tax=Glaciecola sp. MH2013 TaxID=2785524 RepID=UPI0018A0B9F9|nr:VIT domain-containing protein [Glaciecola sp. MH2013]MBF7075073.1 VWA domain-containing protein [Glaciecola sp. MH2013]
MAILQRSLIVVTGLCVFGLIHAAAPNMFTPAYTSLFDNQRQYPSSAESESSIKNEVKTQFSLLTKTGTVNEINVQETNIFYTDPLANLSSSGLFIRAVDEQGKPAFKNSSELSTEVDINVTGMIARTRVSQTFKNNSDTWQDGVYAFPLPENAAVDHLLLKVGNRIIEGQIKQKQEAKKIFEKAKQEGKKASLVVQHRPNIFTNEVANIGPGEEIEVSIEYQQTLRFADGEYSLRYPLDIKERYQPQSSNEDSVEKSNFRRKALTLRVNLASGTHLNNITSENHPIVTHSSANQIGSGASQYEISLADEYVLQKDFVLRWQPELGSQPQTSHFSQWVNGEEYGLVMIYPPLPDENLDQDREITFILDTSGSMAGDAIKQAKQALAFAVDDLAASDKFNIIQFNSHAEQLWRTAKFADSTNKADAFDFIASLTANGGTEMHSALSVAFDSADKAKAENEDDRFFKQILFITDGSVSNEHSLMQLISTRLGSQRLFTIGIGAAPNTYFMTEAAKMGKGSFTFIADTSQVNEKMQTLLEKIKAPALTNIQFNLKALGPNESIEMYPDTIGDLYHEEPMVLSYKKNASATASNQHAHENTDDFADINAPLLVGRYNNNPWQFSLTQELSGKSIKQYQQNKPDNSALNSETTLGTIATRAQGINVLWAREKIAQLSRDKRKLEVQPVESKEQIDSLVTEITQTALAHHIVSQYTSLVAVDTEQTAPEKNIQNQQSQEAMLAEAELKRAQLAIAQAHGLSQQGLLPQTATRAQLNMLIALLLLTMAVLMLWRRKHDEI